MNTANNNHDMISYCGFYCGACPKFKNNSCVGCKGEETKCATGYTSCKVRPCCIAEGINTCADCSKYNSVKDCRLYNPLLIRLGQFLTRSSRRKGIEFIKEKGESEFLKFMIEKSWVTIKLKG